MPPPSMWNNVETFLISILPSCNLFFLVDFDIRVYIVSPSDPALYFGKLSVTAVPVYIFDKVPIKRKE